MRGELQARAQRALDLQTRHFQMTRGISPISGSWLRAVRKALRMRAADMAADLKVSPSMVFQLERSEIKETITLERLKAAADAMECMLVYCVIPKQGKFEDQLMEYVKIAVYGRRRTRQR